MVFLDGALEINEGSKHMTIWHFRSTYVTYAYVVCFFCQGKRDLLNCKKIFLWEKDITDENLHLQITQRKYHALGLQL